MSQILCLEDARNELIRELIEDMQRVEEDYLLNDGRGVRSRPAFVPCPDNIGNDPCDEWGDGWEDEDW